MSSLESLLHNIHTNRLLARVGVRWEKVKTFFKNVIASSHTRHTLSHPSQPRYPQRPQLSRLRVRETQSRQASLRGKRHLEHLHRGFASTNPTVLSFLSDQSTKIGRLDIIGERGTSSLVVSSLLVYRCCKSIEECVFGTALHFDL